MLRTSCIHFRHARRKGRHAYPFPIQGHGLHRERQDNSVSPSLLLTILRSSYSA